MASASAAGADRVAAPQSAVEMLYARELAYPVQDYIQIQPQITTSMRAVLVDWMREVGVEHRVNVETYFISVRLLDRMLAIVPVPRKELQLVGAACLLLAAKLEEVHPLPIRGFEVLCDHLYTRAQFITMETVIMRKLNFKCHSPTMATYAVELLNLIDAPSAVRFAVEYALFLVAVDYNVALLPVAAAAAATVLLALDAVPNPDDTRPLAVALIRALPHAVRAAVPHAAATVATPWARVHTAAKTHVRDAEAAASAGEQVNLRDVPQCRSAYVRYAAPERGGIAPVLALPPQELRADVLALLRDLPYQPSRH